MMLTLVTGAVIIAALIAAGELTGKHETARRARALEALTGKLAKAQPPAIHGSGAAQAVLWRESVRLPSSGSVVVPIEAHAEPEHRELVA